MLLPALSPISQNSPRARITGKDVKAALGLPPITDRDLGQGEVSQVLGSLKSQSLAYSNNVMNSCWVTVE